MIKDDFKKWMKLQNSSKGTPFTKNTLDSYISALNTELPYFRFVDISYKSIYEITDLNECRRLYKKCVFSPKLKEIQRRRGNNDFKLGFEWYMRFLQFKDGLDYDIQEIRILPMSKKIFPTLEETIDFLSNTLRDRNGVYYYIRHNLVCDDALVFFQYDGTLVASAILIEQGTSEYQDENGNKYNGYYKFDLQTMKIFQESITLSQIQTVVPQIKTFSHATQRIDCFYLNPILALMDYYDNQIFEENWEQKSSVSEVSPEGEKKAQYVTKYERDPKNRAAAIKIHGLKCAVCGFDFEKTYGEQGQGFIEVHHIKPLYTLDEVMVINPEMDLICLCSNCHRMIHRKRNQILSVEQLKELYNKNSEV